MSGSIPSDGELLRRAYEEVQRLRAELAAVVKTADVAMNQAVSWEENARRNYSRAERAEAAIARVRVVLEEDVDDDAARYNALRALDGAE